MASDLGIIKVYSSLPERKKIEARLISGLEREAILPEEPKAVLQDARDVTHLTFRLNSRRQYVFNRRSMFIIRGHFEVLPIAAAEGEAEPEWTTVRKTEEARVNSLKINKFFTDTLVSPPDCYNNQELITSFQGNDTASTLLKDCLFTCVHPDIINRYASSDNDIITEYLQKPSTLDSTRTKVKSIMEDDGACSFIYRPIFSFPFSLGMMDDLKGNAVLCNTKQNDIVFRLSVHPGGTREQSFGLSHTKAVANVRFLIDSIVLELDYLRFISPQSELQFNRIVDRRDLIYYRHPTFISRMMRLPSNDTGTTFTVRDVMMPSELVLMRVAPESLTGNFENKEYGMLELTLSNITLRFNKSPLFLSGMHTIDKFDRQFYKDVHFNGLRGARMAGFKLAEDLGSSHVKAIILPLTLNYAPNCKLISEAGSSDDTTKLGTLEVEIKFPQPTTEDYGLILFLLYNDSVINYASKVCKFTNSVLQ